MSKPFSESDIIDQFAQDRNWRLKEISDLKSAIQRADVNLQKVLLRALVAVCYAHWEGFVRFSARKYLEHIALRNISYKNLERQFLRNYFLPRLAALSNTKANIGDRCALVDEILDASSRRFSRINEDIINTGGNLKTEVLADICKVCGIPFSTFQNSEVFIDVILLKRRNAIAHGEDAFVSIDDLESITNGTVALMRGFGDALENRIILRQYLAVSPAD